MDAITKAAKIVGSQQILAQALGVTKSAVSQWHSTGVPIDRCVEIERLTNRAVRCEELNSTVDWAYLRATDCDCHKEVA